MSLRGAERRSNLTCKVCPEPSRRVIPSDARNLGDCLHCASQRPCGSDCHAPIGRSQYLMCLRHALRQGSGQALGHDSPLTFPRPHLGERVRVRGGRAVTIQQHLVCFLYTHQSLIDRYCSPTTLCREPLLAPVSGSPARSGVLRLVDYIWSIPGLFPPFTSCLHSHYHPVSTRFAHSHLISGQNA
jgi:hypothetical protein